MDSIKIQVNTTTTITMRNGTRLNDLQAALSEAAKNYEKPVLDFRHQAAVAGDIRDAGAPATTTITVKEGR